MPVPHMRVTYRVALQNLPGMLARVTDAIETVGATLVSSDRIDATRHVTIRSLGVEAMDASQAHDLGTTLQALDGVEVLAIDDDVVNAHLGGKISIANKLAVNDAHDLSLVYTPGVAQVCRAIAADPTEAYRLTIKSNAVAVVTDGSAVLGLGDIGPLASLPVMEGKAMLLKSFGDVDAYPILVDDQDPDTFVDTVARIASGFGGINLEDISAPRCFEIEGKLRRRLDIPVFHDDQHGTAVVALAALLNAARVVGKQLEDLRVVVQGIGAAGVAIVNLLSDAGITDIVAVDRSGILQPTRGKGMDPIRRRVAKQTNPRELEGDQAVALEGADVFIGVSGPNSLPLAHVARMAADPIVFAMANPTPELHPDEAAGHVAVMATGRSDFPNQINNVLCFPGLFRGLLDAAATKVTAAMKVAAADAIASIVGDDLAADHVIPSPFDRSVARAVADAVTDVARRDGHVRPGSGGSVDTEAAATAHAAVRRTLG